MRRIRQYALGVVLVLVAITLTVVVAVAISARADLSKFEKRHSIGVTAWCDQVNVIRPVVGLPPLNCVAIARKTLKEEK